MKKRVSIFWLSQIFLWCSCILVLSLFYFRLPAFLSFIFYPALFVHTTIALFIITLIRLFIIKTGLLESNIFNKFLYLLPITILLSVSNALLSIGINKIFHWENKSFAANSFGSQILVISFTNILFYGNWILVYFFYHYIEKIRRQQIEKLRLENELIVQQLKSEKTNSDLLREKAELQTQALRAQMNPHFIFNSLNSINRFILQNEKVLASEYLTKFSRLVRLILQNSQAALILLESELESLELYLELEALRFDHRFEYKISVPNDLDIEMIKVPPLIIQPYAENAIWHGLMNKEDKGHLNIQINQEEKYLVLKVIDDGIGRKAASELAAKNSNKYQSVGLKITAERIAVMQNLKGKETPVIITDLVNPDGSAAGTEVNIKIPLIYD